MFSYFCFFIAILALLFYLFIYRKLKEQNIKLLNENIKFKNLAMIDALTEIPNRRFLDKIYTKLYKEHFREKSTLAVFMIDIDNFKAYNDFYGHVKGDVILVQIAKELQKTLKRPTDFIARYGGEEFAIILKEINIDGILKIANELIIAIKILQIPHEKSKILPYITISIGIAYKDAKVQITQDEFLAYADRALYRAKEDGKNRYIVCEKTFLHP